MAQQNVSVVIIGGGLAGLVSAIHLATHKIDVVLIEKNTYPQHKVCGEYISNEVLPYLNALGFNPFDYGAQRLSHFELTTHNNKRIRAKLPLGGFGLSRYTMDNALYQLALQAGAKVIQDKVIDVAFKNDTFLVTTISDSSWQANQVIGAFGKRSNLDTIFQRPFIKKKSAYLAVKTHVSGDYPENTVALHHFKGGYCGVSKVGDNCINICYITTYKSFKTHKSISSFQNAVVCQNNALKTVFKNTQPIFETPLSISQISFQTKQTVVNHMLMCGDAAGMIHPLCGNGMAMAIRGAQLASELIIEYLHKKIRTRHELENRYKRQWNKQFSLRLSAGHAIAYLLRQEGLASKLITLLRWFPFVIPWLITMTHGKPMVAPRTDNTEVAH